MFQGREKGFTLVELMIVVVIIGILASVAVPKFSSLIVRAKVVGAKKILNQIIHLEKTYFMTHEQYKSFALGQDQADIGFEQPDNARFTYSFSIDAGDPSNASIATAIEIGDINVNGNNDTDGLTLTLGGTQGMVGSDISW